MVKWQARGTGVWQQILTCNVTCKNNTLTWNWGSLMDTAPSGQRGFHSKHTLLKTRQSQGVSVFLRPTPRAKRGCNKRGACASDSVPGVVPVAGIRKGARLHARPRWRSGAGAGSWGVSNRILQPRWYSAVFRWFYLNGKCFDNIDVGYATSDISQY